MKICIIGMGVLGITYASILSDSDVDVIGVDQDEELIEMLNDGELPVYEPGLRPLMAASLDSKKLTFTSNFRQAIKESEIIFITCEVPNDVEEMPDLRFVKPIAQSIGNHLENHATIVVKSTVPPGSCRLIRTTIQKALDERQVDISFDIVSNPDFSRKGVMIKDCLVPEMVVIGAESDQAVENMKSLYDSLHVQEENYVITNFQSAELIKYGVNAFLSIKLSFINEIALLCENANANILDVSKGIGKDFRIGHEYLEAGSKTKG
ncbi:MAG: UDPglucose 6-dehydrogenase [Eubacteriaceae bacterium]|nr:UDPglucose 6-dehydrogenase [Eubacteriaceae bacterium]